MATKNRTELKEYFETGKRPTQEEFENLIDSNLNIEEDKASLADAQNDQVDNKYLTPQTGKQTVLAFAPVKKVNNVSPDSNGNVSITNVTGSASTITGSISKSQVTGLENDLNGKQATLVSGTNIKTINGQPIIGVGDLPIAGSSPIKLIAVPSFDFTLSNSNSPQNAFPSGCNQFSLSANKTYFFKGKYLISNGTMSHTTAISWVLSLGLNISTMEYVARIFSSSLNGTSTTSTQIQISGPTSKVLNAASTAQTTTIEFEGVLRCTSAGILTPRLTFSQAPGDSNLIKVGSFIEFTEIGSNSIQTVGAVS
ncbi:MAG: hypothetical protein IM568_08420 [Flavobacterium sp.]|nr:hypothetical protein [Flavobacterium sp.]